MSTPIPPEPTTLYPPLFPWLRRMGYAMGAMILLLFAVRLAWGWYAQHTLDAMLADVQRRGYPITEEQLVASVPPNADDAAPLLRRAVAAIAHDPPDTYAPFSAADAADIDTLCFGSPGPLDFLHQAAQLKVARWNIRSDPGWSFRDLRTFAHFRTMSRLAYDAALLAHQRHQDRRAIAPLLDILQMSCLSDQTHHLIGHLVAISIDATFSQSVIQLASDLEIADHNTNTDRAALRATVMALITTLGDEESLRTGMAQSWDGSRVSNLALIDNARWNWLYKPLGQLNAASFMHAIDIQQEASAAETWPAAFEKLRPIDLQLEQDSLDNLSILTHIYRPEYIRVVLLHFRDFLDHRIARLFLAVRLFQIDHEGHLPDKLAELCPMYLPQIPADPFSKNAQPLGYVNDGKNPRIYSVGENGIDDGGTIRNVEDGIIRRWRDKGTIVYTYYRQVNEARFPARNPTSGTALKAPQKK